MGIRPRGDGTNALSVQFPNGSRIVGLPGVEATVRGFSAVSLLMIDEAARVEDEVYKTLRPMLATTNGDVWLMSTPRGKRGFFYEAWARGGERWARMAVKGTECPRIGAEFLEDERRELGAAWFRQEYLCEFLDNGCGVFERDLIEEAVTEAVKPFTTEARRAQSFFYLGVDLGQDHDPAALAVVEVERATHAWMVSYDSRMKVRYLERLALGTPYPEVARRVEALAWKLGRCDVAVDATGLGKPVADLLREMQLPGELAAVKITAGDRESRAGGVWNVPKRDLIGGVKVLLEKRELQIAKELRETGPLVRELLDVKARRRASGRERLGADGAGEHDDLVIAVALACWMGGRPEVGYGPGRVV